MLGPILLQLNDTATVYVPAAKVAPAGLRHRCGEAHARDTLHGPQARDDTNSYRVWQKTDAAGGPPGAIWSTSRAQAVWLVDPGINGAFTERPDGTTVRKFDAPKATLMSYIIKGILDRHLPWALVLLGVMIAVTLELCGVSSLVFAVGVYLPLSSSAPLFVGGAIRWLADRYWSRQPSHAHLDAERPRCGVRQEPGRSAGLRLHRRRGDRGHPDRDSCRAAWTERMRR